MNKKAEMKVLVVEDDATLNTLIAEQIGRLGHEALPARSGSEARALLAESEADLALLDIRLPDCDGLELLAELAPLLPVVAMTAYGTVDQAMRAVRSGAADYLTKPVSFDNLELVIQRVFDTVELKRDVQYWQAQARRASGTAIVGESEEVREMCQLVSLYGDADSPVLIEGESGVGKELVARAIHDASSRASGRFVPIDCDPNQENVITAELFGHEPGAFAGAEGRVEGMLEFADRGTIYLGDIAEVSSALQSKILRVIETGRFRRLGGSTDMRSDVRILVGTNRDLEDEVRKGRFRSELYYQLSAFRIHVPALRDRLGDVKVLARHFLNSRGFHLGADKELAPETVDLLEHHDWPGNVRELANVIERGLIISGKEALIQPRHIGLPDRDSAHATGESGVNLAFPGTPTMEELRDAYLRELLRRFEGNRSKVAAVMGISERNLYRLVRKLGEG